ncbi:putative peptide-N(4)-(N-acetyl-beta-glucosaminyl)asparagine amidase [Dioscorea sansibarensis]
MGEALGQSKLVAPCGVRRSASPLPKRKPSLVAFRRSSSASPSFRSLGSSSLRRSGFLGEKLVFGDRRGESFKGRVDGLHVKMNLSIGKGLKWWEKGLQPNMKEIQSAQELVDSLLNGENKLIIVDFFSPGCGGCKALHPKMCQFAEMNPEITFLQVNHEKHKSMCYSLNVHVLPFFRFYRGAHGRLCSFSCTNATIKKFKDALAKHGTERCSLGPAKGLEESELMALASNKDLSFRYTMKPMPVEQLSGLNHKEFVVPPSRGLKLKESESKEEALVR